MQYFTTDIAGITLMNPDPSQRRDVLKSLEDGIDADYPEVFLNIDSGIVLGYRSGGFLAWEEEGEVTRYLEGISVEMAEQIWNWLIDDNQSGMESLDWQDIED
ncbi:MAG: hypothetical protein AB3N63_16945 [Puniceicoccaceae bacterium]